MIQTHSHRITHDVGWGELSASSTSTGIMFQTSEEPQVLHTEDLFASSQEQENLNDIPSQNLRWNMNGALDEDDSSSTPISLTSTGEVETRHPTLLPNNKS